MRHMCAILVLLLGVVTVNAQTPDGVCAAAGLTGAAYGLCNSYCEALDCDSAAPKASAQACSRVRANFQRATDGQDLPCEVTCPCPYPFPFSAWFSGFIQVECTTTRTTGRDGGLQHMFVEEIPHLGIRFCGSSFEEGMIGLTRAELHVCSVDVLAYLKALRDARGDLDFFVISGAPDLDSCEPIPAS